MGYLQKCIYNWLVIQMGYSNKSLDQQIEFFFLFFYHYSGATFLCTHKSSYTLDKHFKKVIYIKMLKLLFRVALILVAIEQTFQTNKITDTSVDYEPESYKGGQQRVVDFFAYDGEDDLLQQKIKLTQSYVDYYYIFEALYYFDGSLKGLKFNKMDFQQYQAKIIYVPVRKFPHLGSKLTQNQIQQNYNYFFGIFQSFFSTIIAESTVIIESEIGSIVKQQDILKFKSSSMNSQCLKGVEAAGQKVLNQLKIRLLKFNIIIGKGKIQKELDISGFPICHSRNFYQKKQYQPSSKDKTVYLKNPTKRLVIQSTPYNGQNHLLSLKLEIQKQFVDYYILTEAPYTHTGVYKGLYFNISNFAEYAHKIIYIPLLSLPYLYSGTDLNYHQRWQNEYFMRNQAILVLNVFAQPQDILFISDLDEMVSKDGFEQFDPEKDDYAYTQLRFYLLQFNKRLVFDSYKKAVKNYGYQSTRILRYEYFQKEYNLEIWKARAQVCNHPERIIEKTQGLKCPHKLIRFAGWHFSSILRDDELIKKIRSIADASSSKRRFNLTELRMGKYLVQDSYLQQFDLLQAYLPVELVNDVIKNKQKSIYADFLAGVNYEALSRIDQKTLQQIRAKQRMTEINQRLQEQARLAQMRLKYFQEKRNLVQPHKIQIRILYLLIIALLVIVALLWWKNKNRNRHEFTQQSQSSQIGEQLDSTHIQNNKAFEGSLD